MNTPLSTGYIAKPHLPQHELGDVWPVINPTGQWLSFSPQPEVQQNEGVESNACTSFGTLDALETLLKSQFNDATEWSARFLAYASGTTAQGNDPMSVAETLAAKGTVPESDWPNSVELTTWADFYSVPPQNEYTKALEWVAQYALQKRWVSTDPASLKAALEISPLGVAGYAWAEDENGLYYTPEGAEPCHWFALLDYVDGQYFVAFDSYSQDIKHLRWDYTFNEAMQYRITRQVVNQSGWQRFLQIMQSILGL